MALDTPSEDQSSVDLRGPWPDGKITVHRPGEALAAAKLRYASGRWEHSTGNTVYVDPTTKEYIVDIRAAVQQANEQFPGGPE